MTDSTQFKSRDHVITPAFAPRSVAFTYRGAISDAGIKALCEQISLAIDLYQPKHLAVQLDSPGGSARALDYWLHRIGFWEKKGVKIETMADTECASAAALMVAFGAVGRRFAHPLSRLHFHNPRLQTSGPTEMLEHHAENFVRVLKASRTRMHAQLQNHLFDSIGKIGVVQTLQSRAQWLLSRGRVDSASDLAKISHQNTSHPDISTAIAVWSQEPSIETDYVESVLSEWEKRVGELFDRDCQVDLKYAWALCLIDASDELPSLVERPHTDDEEPEKIQLKPSLAISPVST